MGESRGTRVSPPENYQCKLPGPQEVLAKVQRIVDEANLTGNISLALKNHDKNRKPPASRRSELDAGMKKNTNMTRVVPESSANDSVTGQVSAAQSPPLVIFYTDFEPDDVLAIAQLWEWKNQAGELGLKPIVIFCADFEGKDGGTTHCIIICRTVWDQRHGHSATNVLTINPHTPNLIERIGTCVSPHCEQTCQTNPHTVPKRGARGCRSNATF